MAADHSWTLSKGRVKRNCSIELSVFLTQKTIGLGVVLPRKIAFPHEVIQQGVNLYTLLRAEEGDINSQTENIFSSMKDTSVQDLQQWREGVVLLKSTRKNIAMARGNQHRPVPDT